MLTTPDAVGGPGTLPLLGGVLDGSVRTVLVLELKRPGQSVLVDPTMCESVVRLQRQKYHLSWQKERFPMPSSLYCSPCIRFIFVVF